MVDEYSDDCLGEQEEGAAGSYCALRDEFWWNVCPVVSFNSAISADDVLRSRTLPFCRAGRQRTLMAAEQILIYSPIL